MTRHADACEGTRRELGGYVLGGIDDEARATVAAHLRDCPVCLGEYERLRDLPSLLSLTIDAPPAPPPSLRGRVLAQAATTVAGRTRRRRVLHLVAAVLVGVVLGAGGMWLAAQSDAGDAVQIALEPGQGFASDGRMRLHPTDNGVTVDLDLRNLPPIGPDEVYELWFAPPDSPPLSVGTFRPDPSGDADVTLSAAGPVERYASAWVTLEPDFTDPAHDGPTVVAAPIP